jgi:cytochrome c
MLLRAPETRRIHRAMQIRLTALPFLIAIQVTPVADLQNPSVRHGHTLVEAACAVCHAVGRFDASPLKSAPPLREVHKRYPVEDLAEALAEGLITGHPSKPEFRFDARDVDDIIDYLKSLEQWLSCTPVHEAKALGSCPDWFLALCLVLLGLELTAGEPSACNLPFSGNNLKKVSNASARQRMVHLVLSQE